MRSENYRKSKYHFTGWSTFGGFEIIYLLIWQSCKSVFVSTSESHGLIIHTFRTGHDITEFCKSIDLRTFYMRLLRSHRLHSSFLSFPFLINFIERNSFLCKSIPSTTYNLRKPIRGILTIGVFFRLNLFR